MEKFIPYEKLSKKKKRELNNQKRNVWELNPITRKTGNKKAYNRKTWKREERDVMSSFYFANFLCNVRNY